MSQPEWCILKYEVRGKKYTCSRYVENWWRVNTTFRYVLMISHEGCFFSIVILKSSIHYSRHKLYWKGIREYVIYSPLSDNLMLMLYIYIYIWIYIYMSSFYNCIIDIVCAQGPCGLLLNKDISFHFSSFHLFNRELSRWTPSFLFEKRTPPSFYYGIKESGHLSMIDPCCHD